ncbi:MAG: glycoside hydrolase family 16 protein [Bacteroidota bacterium]
MQRSIINPLFLIATILLILSWAEKEETEKFPHGQRNRKGVSPGNCNVKPYEIRIYRKYPSQKTTERVISFAGYKWHVKSGYAAPGRNFWSGSTENVWKDKEGLHLKITRREGKWYCAEIFSDQSFGYGKYTFYLIGRPDHFDKKVVLGLFTYPDPEGYREAEKGPGEIDIEFAKELIKGPNNTQYAIHYNSPEGESRAWNYPFQAALKGDYSTHSFNWQPASVDFRSIHGHREGTNNPRSIIGEKAIRGSMVPTPGNMKVHINLWLYDANHDGRGDPPKDGDEVEIVIRDFKFTPLESGAR